MPCKGLPWNRTAKTLKIYCMQQYLGVFQQAWFTNQPSKYCRSHWSTELHIIMHHNFTMSIVLHHIVTTTIYYNLICDDETKHTIPMDFASKAAHSATDINSVHFLQESSSNKSPLITREMLRSKTHHDSAQPSTSAPEQVSSKFFPNQWVSSQPWGHSSSRYWTVCTSKVMCACLRADPGFLNRAFELGIVKGARILGRGVCSPGKCLISRTLETPFSGFLASKHEPEKQGDLTKPIKPR